MRGEVNDGELVLRQPRPARQGASTQRVSSSPTEELFGPGPQDFVTPAAACRVALHTSPPSPPPHLTSPHHRLCPIRRHTSRDHVVRTRRPRRSHSRSRPRHQPVSRHLARRRLQWRAYSTARPEHLDTWPAWWTRDHSQRHHQQQCARPRQQVVSSIVTPIPRNAQRASRRPP
jgi:hypothetical protein